MIKHVASVASAGLAVALCGYAGVSGRQGTADAAPVGTVVAYAGSFTPEGVRALEEKGWLPCDGRVLRGVDGEGKPTAYAGLAAVLGKGFGAGYDAGAAEATGDFNVPDLRGRFVRGVDGGTNRDSDAASRKAMRRGGNAGDAVGSMEEYSTALPSGNPFRTDAQGAHGKHWGGSAFGGEFGAYSVLSNPGSETTLGEHTHTILGGDPETRPVNLALNWIIKFR